MHDTMKTRSGPREPAGREPWYVPHPRLRTRSAAAEAVRVATWIDEGAEPADAPQETDMFIALHVCACRATRDGTASSRRTGGAGPWLQRWERIRGHLVERNLGLVYAMLERVKGRFIDRDALVSDAMLALLRAVDRFDPWQGFRFSTYACNIIIRTLLRRRKALARQQKRFPVQFEPDFERPARMTDEARELYVERLDHALRSNTASLTDIEARVLRSRFCSGKRSKRTYKEIAATTGMSKEGVRQVQVRALNKLRDALHEDPVLR